MQSILLGGLFIGVLSALPIINVANCCCLWIVGGGLLAAYLEQQNQQRSLPVARGALLGLGAGVVGAFIWLFASLALDSVVAPLQQRMVEAMLRGADQMPPDARAMLESIGDRASTPFRFIVGFVFVLFAGMVFSTIGGAVGAAFFKRDTPPPLGGETPDPPPLPPSR
jgi:hypothetical protein